MSARPALVALGVVVLAVLAFLGWSRFAPSGMSPAAAAAAVHQMRGADAEFFYLGEEADGLLLADVVDPGDGGRLIFEYGRCMDHDEGGCNRPLNVLSVAAPSNVDETQPTVDSCVREVLGQGNEVLIGGPGSRSSTGARRRTGTTPTSHGPARWFRSCGPWAS